MAYDVKKVTKLGHLRQLMDKSRQELASKTSLEELAEQVDGIIAEGGEPNVITGVKVNGTALYRERCPNWTTTADFRPRPRCRLW